MPGSSSNSRSFWITAAVVVALDIVTKRLAVANLALHIPRPVFGEFARLTLAYNPGAAFSMSLGSYSRVLFGAFALVALVVLWWIHRGGAPDERLKSFALGLAWGGAAGNLLDRIRSAGGVVDFIDVGVGTIRFWTFNVADSAVTIGACVLAWVLWQEERRRAPASD
jgi:signal peptidase II